MKMLDIQKTLEKKVKKLAREMFGWEMNKPVLISSRMKRTLGQYVWKINQDTNKPELVRFQFAAKLFRDGYMQEDIDLVIKHELIHWYTDTIAGRPCHHNKIWKANCKRFGIPDSRLTSLKSKDGKLDYKWMYKCTNPRCGAVYNRYRRIPKNYVCGKCKGTLKEYPLSSIVRPI